MLERAGLLALTLALFRFAFGSEGRGAKGAGGVYSGAAARKGLSRSLGFAQVLVSMDELLPCADVSSRLCCGAGAAGVVVAVVVRAGVEEEAGVGASAGAGTA